MVLLLIVTLSCALAANAALPVFGQTFNSTVLWRDPSHTSTVEVLMLFSLDQKARVLRFNEAGTTVRHSSRRHQSRRPILTFLHYTALLSAVVAVFSVRSGETVRRHRRTVHCLSFVGADGSVPRPNRLQSRRTGRHSGPTVRRLAADHRAVPGGHVRLLGRHRHTSVPNDDAAVLSGRGVHLTVRLHDFHVPQEPACGPVTAAEGRPAKVQIGRISTPGRKNSAVLGLLNE